jgi:hypothetical protein
VPGWTDAAVDTHVQFLASLSHHRVTQGKHFAFILPWSSPSWHTRAVKELRKDPTVRLQTSSVGQGSEMVSHAQFEPFLFGAGAFKNASVGTSRHGEWRDESTVLLRHLREDCRKNLEQ